MIYFSYPFMNLFQCCFKIICSSVSTATELIISVMEFEKRADMPGKQSNNLQSP